MVSNTGNFHRGSSVFQAIFDALGPGGIVQYVDNNLIEENKRKFGLYNWDYVKGITEFFCQVISAKKLQKISNGNPDERPYMLFHSIPPEFITGPKFGPTDSFQREIARRFHSFSIPNYRNRGKELRSRDLGPVVCIGKFSTDLGTFYQYIYYPCFGPRCQTATKVKGVCETLWYSYYEDGSGFAYIELADWPTYQKYLLSNRWSRLSLCDIFATDNFLSHLEFAEKHVSHELVVALDRNYFHDMLFHVARWRPRPWLKTMLKEGIEIYKTQFQPKFGTNLNIECMFGLAADTCSLFEYTKNYSHPDKDSNFSKDVDMFIDFLEKHGIRSHLF